jgi:hypothetical protein
MNGRAVGGKEIVSELGNFLQGEFVKFFTSPARRPLWYFLNYLFSGL